MARIENWFPDIQTKRNFKLGNVLEKLTHQHKERDQVRSFYMIQDDCANDPETNSFTPRQNNARSFDKRVVSYFQRTRPHCKNESFSTTGTQKKIDCSSVGVFCSHCSAVFKATCCFYDFFLDQEVQPSLTEEVIQPGSKKTELDKLGQHCIRKKKASLSFYCRSMNGGDCTRQASLFKKRIREIVFYRRSLAAEELLEEIKNGKFSAKFNATLQYPKL